VPWPLEGTNHLLVALTGSEKIAMKSKPVIPQGNTEWILKVCWTGNPFFVKPKA